MNASADSLSTYGSWIALVVCFVMALLAVRSLEPPAPLSEDAPSASFSGHRAAATLGYLLGDETPHPVGSPANEAVRDRLVTTLASLGLTAEIQRTVACSQKAPICANVENVLAEIPGETRDAVVMMAHYDSVPHAPGAADDGSGVAAILESARALLLEPARRNRILLVFTDAEEMGLLGAEGFFADHPWVADVKAVINIEGSGSSGPSLLLRSSNMGGHLLSAFRESATAPVAISYAQEVFARMPNDTDFTVPDRAGIASIDFAFAFEFNHYHTPLDSLANLDRGTLQHHGENVLPLVRRLAETDLAVRTPNFSYLTVEQAFWIVWPAQWGIAIAAFALLVLAAGSVHLRPTLTLRHSLGGIVLAIGAMISGVAGCFITLWLADLLVGTTVSFPATAWPWRLLMLGGALLPICLLCWWAQQRLNFWARFLGIFWVLGLLALALAIAAPLAANLLVVPVLIAVLLSSIVIFFLDSSNPRLQVGLALLVTAQIAYTLFSMSYAMEQSQGLRLAPAIYIGLVWIGMLFLAYNSGSKICGALGLAIVAGWIWAATAPLYSQWRPQHVSLYYVFDHDHNQAQWSVISANPLPDPLIDAFGTVPESRPIAPWATNQVFNTFNADPVDLPAAEVTVNRRGPNVRVRVRSQDSGDFTQLILPESTGVTTLSMAGKRVTVTASGGFLRARFFAAGNDALEFEFNVSESGSFEGYIVDGSHTLPAIGAPYSRARGSLAVPQHQGDQRIAFQRIQF